MLKRKITEQILEWKKNKNKKCLILEGARQIGKSYIVNYIGEKYYKRFVNINFLISKKYKTIFDEDLDIETIKRKIKSFNEFKDIELNKDCLLFLDEIQECPNALVALKSLSIANEFDVITSGSYLGIKYKEISSFPVGYVEYMKMYPLDFEEFLWAKNVSCDLIKNIKNCFNNRIKIDSIIHNQMTNWFKEYMIIGGMPEVVSSFVKINDFFSIRKIQQDIIQMFFSDAMKYAPTFEKQKIIECFNSIPTQLSKENKKFMFSKIQKNARSKWYYSALNWLVDSNIVNKCVKVNALDQPLNAYEDNDSFKIYLCDNGLLLSMLDDVVVSQILNNEHSIYTGAIFENMIAQMLVVNNHKLRYFERNHTLEVDFILSLNNEINIIEVKSQKNRSKSLSTLMSENNKFKGIVLNYEPTVSFDNNLLKIPWYLAFLIE